MTTVLVAGGNEVQQELTQGELENHGYSVVGTDPQKEHILEAIATLEPDILFTFGGIAYKGDGPGTYGLLEAMTEEGVSLPVIMATSTGFEQNQVSYAGHLEVMPGMPDLGEVVRAVQEAERAISDHQTTG